MNFIFYVFSHFAGFFLLLSFAGNGLRKVVRCAHLFNKICKAGKATKSQSALFINAGNGKMDKKVCVCVCVGGREGISFQLNMSVH